MIEVKARTKAARKAARSTRNRLADNLPERVIPLRRPAPRSRWAWVVAAVLVVGGVVGTVVLNRRPMPLGPPPFPGRPGLADSGIGADLGSGSPLNNGAVGSRRRTGGTD